VAQPIPGVTRRELQRVATGGVGTEAVIEGNAVPMGEALADFDLIACCI